MQQLDHVVIPITQLKQRATAVFDTLAHEQRVYVAKHGHVIAAIDPYPFVPQDVLAAFAAPVAPGASFSELTARHMGRAVPSVTIARATRRPAQPCH